MVTPETLTDEMVHEHLDWLTQQPYIGEEQRRSIRDGIRLCAAALVPDGRRVVAVWWDAREKIAVAINARATREAKDAIGGPNSRNHVRKET